ncbi:hypothetical protein B0T24DRAFT_630802 [Lasiosphaeria ovina]|uniref:FAR1 domain-containing protein n=1 Tax=Lasiosphaeria ovina TaxID=92902 RepID=A0AAE0K3E2_9PEZI|nr:hypothetical protein B0T24DRAFT_630802 [Lasiosphaeria ovina]
MDDFDDDSEDFHSCASVNSGSSAEEVDQAVVAPNVGTVALLSSPPKGHKLLAHRYDTFEELLTDLEAFAISAYFTVVKNRSNNKVDGFGYTRIKLCCSKGSRRKSKAISRNTSTGKVGCP